MVHGTIKTPTHQPNTLQGQNYFFYAYVKSNLVHETFIIMLENWNLAHELKIHIKIISRLQRWPQPLSQELLLSSNSQMKYRVLDKARKLNAAYKLII